MLYVLKVSDGQSAESPERGPLGNFYSCEAGKIPDDCEAISRHNQRSERRPYLELSFQSHHCRLPRPFRALDGQFETRLDLMKR